MAKKIITFAVDQSKLFDTVQEMQGNVGPFGERVLGAMLTGKTGLMTDIGLAFYGVAFIGQEDASQDDESSALPASA